MNIKVGDKVRIKTEQQLLTEGWQADGRRLRKGEMWLWTNCLGYEYNVRKNDGCKLELDSGVLVPVETAEVIPQTLDEYICSLPLEERAKYFMHYIPSLDFGDDWYGSSLFKNRSFLCYDEALQATIEALKQPKE